MTKKTLAPKKAQPKRRTSKTAQVTTTCNPDLPPLASAIAIFCAPGYNGVRPQFQQAWAAVPGLMRTMSEKHESSEAIDVHIRQQGEAALALSRDADNRFDQQLAKAVDLLSEANEDYIYTLYSAWSDPAFNVGLALGVYLALNVGSR